MAGSAPRRPQELLAAAGQMFAAGRLDAAHDLAAAVVRVAPRHPQALRIMGLSRLRAGRTELAIPLLERAAAADPRSALAQCDLGMAFLVALRLAEAEKHLDEALRLNPAFPEALINRGIAHAQRAERARAIECYTRALTLRPDFPDALVNIALLELESGLLAEAEGHARRAVGLVPRSAQAHRVLGKTLGTRDRIEEAKAAFAEALRLDPNLADAHFELGMMLFERGRLAEAVPSFRKALALRPNAEEIRQALDWATGASPDEARLAREEARLVDPRTSPNERMLIGYRLGEAYEQRGDYPRALAAFRGANAIHRATFRYSTAEQAEAFEDLRQAFTRETVAARRDVGSTRDGVIFVVGMPRSGTTLTEQILASHPLVHGRGETTLFSDVSGSLRKDSGPVRFARMVPSLTDADIRWIGDTFVERARVDADDRAYVTEKLPENFRLAGMIAMALPKARIVSCVRDPADTCLSIFKRHFSGRGLQYGYDLTELGEFYRLYADLMDYWNDVLPRPMYTVRLEALIADQRGETEKLLDAVGLPWDEACMSFHETERAVRTASVMQVRRPINESGVGVAARYGSGLDELRRALAGAGHVR